MLGSYVKVKVTNPVGDFNSKHGYKYSANYGRIIDCHGHASDSLKKSENKEAYILGIKHPVREFEGRIIARAKRASGKVVWIVAPKNRKYINIDIHNMLDSIEKEHYKSEIQCFYEKSCGAVIFAMVKGQPQFLLIKNRRSLYWGFPKGHIESGETEEETALREVLEETGLKIRILKGFAAKSDYHIQNKVEKTVTIFLAQTEKRTPKLQKDEVEDFYWGNYDDAMKRLKFENDRSILRRANNFLQRKGYIQKSAI